MTCARCGEQIVAPERPHGSIGDCLHALRFTVAGLSLYVARAELEALAARRQTQELKTLLQRIADIARPGVATTALPSLMRRIRKLANGQPFAKGKSTAA